MIIDEHAGKTLVLHYTVKQEYRVTIPPGSGGVSSAIYETINNTVAAGYPGIDPLSLHFSIED